MIVDVSPEYPLSAALPDIWNVVFYSHDEQRGWWDKLSPAGFRHVLAFGFSVSADRWIVYDVTRDQTMVAALHVADFDRWLRTLPPNRTIIKIDAVRDAKASGWRLGFWCTRGVAHLLGVPSRALRPVALYRELLRRGAVPAFTAPGPQDD